MKSVNLLSISYAKKLFDPLSREYERLLRLAHGAESVQYVVPTRRTDQFREMHDGPLHTYPTNSQSKVGMIVDAVRIGRRVIAAQREKTWVVSSQDPFESGVVGRIISWLTGVPHHIQIHSDFYRNKHWLSKRSNRWRAWLGLRLLKSAAAVRVVGADIKKSLVARGVPDEKITVLPVYIEVDTFLAVGKERLAHITPTPRRFVFVGRFSEEKNVPLLIEAYAQVAARHPDSHLTIVGDGPDRPLLETLIARHTLATRTTHVPWTNDVAGALKNQDIFLLTSHREGWPLVIMEAHAAALPVVATRVGTIDSVVEEGISGFLVPPDDVVAYVAAMERMLSPDTDYQAMVRAAYTIAKKHAAWQRSYSELWIDTFRRALPTKG